jgi:hypothetical protein
MNTDYEHFGTPLSNMVAAKKTKKSLFPRPHPHSYVPTRNEVAYLEAHLITKILTGWMCQSPTEIIPSRTQVAEARDILLGRPDAAHLSGIITMCNYYINGD